MENIHNVSSKRLPVLKTMKDNKRLFLQKQEKNWKGIFREKFTSAKKTINRGCKKTCASQGNLAKGRQQT